jgi:hypothetical protein
MKHEDFPVKGFEFMNEPASDEQKCIIVDLATRAGHNLEADCLTNPDTWPKPFSKWDAGNMITALKEQLEETAKASACECDACKMAASACETFCHACGQFRLWLKPEDPTACGNCGSTRIDIDDINSERLEKLREEYKKSHI